MKIKVNKSLEDLKTIMGIKEEPKMKRLTLKQLRYRFRFDALGKPLLEDYGIFVRGITSDEIEDYIRVRLNSFNISKVKNKLNEALNGSTAPFEVYKGKHVPLIYRHDVERHLNSILDGTETYFD